jgi:pimeloyl-ACP methyl ester carboxylesterase
MTRRAQNTFLLILAACRPAEPPSDAAAPPAWEDPASHAERFVTAIGVRLHVLDWGGTGPALVLIHGYGDSPHIFDDFVPALGGRFRVVAYARRGHGKSSGADDFSNTALAADLIAVMDSLGIARASLAGWSMGGNEITAAAGMYPDRVERIVYLDAGYDWSDPALAASMAELPISLDPPPEARASLEAYKAWWVPTWIPDADAGPLEAHLRDVANPGPDGTLRPVPDSANSARAFAALLSERRDYRRVRAPALAIYSEIFLSQPGKDSAATAAIRAWEAKHMVPFRTASQARLRKELKDLEIITVPGSHASFMLVSRDTVAKTIRRFLGAVE